MSLHALVQRAYTEPLAIAPEFLQGVIAGFEHFARLGGDPAQFLASLQPAGSASAPDIERVGDVAIIPIRGAILKHPDASDCEMGCCDVDMVRLHANIAAADPTVSQVILHIDSPGGSVVGVPEAGAALSRLADKKPVYAWTETVMASAAYWFGSQARAVFSSTSARLGSIGVYSLYMDASKLMEEFGVKVNAMQAGKFKLAGAPFRAMSDEERAHLQRRTDRVRDQFHAAVSNRRSLKAEHMEGQTFDAEEAVQHGLSDGIVNSIDELLSLITSDHSR